MQVLEAIAVELAESGWSVSTGLLPEDVLVELAAEGARQRMAGFFRPAGLGRGQARTLAPEVRSDETLWLDPQALTPAQKPYWEAMGRLRSELNRQLFLGLQELEAHLAVYPPGAFYRRHLNRFAGSDERAVSTVLYLNSSWREGDGGELRLHLDGGPVDVSPLIGTMVVFRSELIWHEVLPTLAPRLSIAGWYRRRALTPRR